MIQKDFGSSSASRSQDVDANHRHAPSEKAYCHVFHMCSWPFLGARAFLRAPNRSLLVPSRAWARYSWPAGCAAWPRVAPGRAPAPGASPIPRPRATARRAGAPRSSAWPPSTSWAARVTAVDRRPQGLLEAVEPPLRLLLGVGVPEAVHEARRLQHLARAHHGALLDALPQHPRELRGELGQLVEGRQLLQPRVSGRNSL